MRNIFPAMTAAVLLAGASPVMAGAGQDSIMKHYQQQAAGKSFSASRGKALFDANHTGGKAETPSCTSCHTKSPLKTGRTRAGKDIAPMALSRTPDRYTDLKKVEKWFRRNCRSVLGRECTTQEKGDFLSYMFSQ